MSGVSVNQQRGSHVFYLYYNATIFCLCLAIASPKLKRNKGSAVIALSREENKFDELYIIVTLSSETRLPSQIPLAEVS